MKRIATGVLLVVVAIATLTAAPVGNFDFLFLNGNRLTASSGTAVVTVPASTDTLVGRATTDTFTGKTLNAESTGNVLTLPFVEWWPAMQLESGGGAFAGWDSTATPTPPVAASHVGTYTVSATADFEESGTESLQRRFKLPADWTGAIDLSILWYSTATSGNVVWQVQTVCVADNESDDQAWNTAQTVTDATKGTASRVNVAALSSVTTTGCAADELLHLKLLRDPAHASDTLGATASLVGVSFTYRRAM